MRPSDRDQAFALSWRTVLRWPQRIRASARSLGENHVIKWKRQEIRMPNEKGMSHQMGMSNEMRMSNGHGGHLYTQTNEIRNAIIHYRRDADGGLTEVERCSTGGAGSGTFKPISGQESAPNAFEGAGSIALTPDRRFL